MCSKKWHRNLKVYLTFMFLVDLNIDCVDAFLNIVPRQKLLALCKRLPSLLD